MKTVLVTGGAKRLGRAVVEHYAAKGWRVLFTARSSFEDGAKLEASLGANVHVVRSGVDNRQSASAVAKWAASVTSSLDLLVCSGSSFVGSDLADTTADMAQELVQSNFFGPYFLIQQCSELLHTAGGSVVTIGDIQVQGGVRGFSMYVATKAALTSLTKSASIELAPRVRVNMVMPGTMPWPESDAVYSEQDKQRIFSEIPLGKLGSWADIVQAIEYLESAKYVTGACLPVDGGRSALA